MRVLEKDPLVLHEGGKIISETAERIEPERLAPFVEHRPSVLTDHLIEARPLSRSAGHGRWVHFASRTGDGYERGDEARGVEPDTQLG